MRLARTVVLYPLTFAVALGCTLLSDTGEPMHQGKQPGEHFLARARRAVGNEPRILEIRTLLLSGVSLNGYNGVTGEPLMQPRPVEFRMAFPDRYVRIDRFGSMSHYGFRRREPIAFIRPLSHTVNVSQPRPNTAFVPIHRARATRYLLGMLGLSRFGLDLQLTPVDGDSLNVRAEQLSATLEIDPVTGLPLRLRYVDVVRFPQPLTEAERQAGLMNTGRSQTVEVTMSFEDRRPVEGLLLPHVIRRTAKGMRVEELRFDRIIVNPPLTDSDFPIR